VALSGMGQDFSFSASSSTATITPGQTANYMIAVNPIAGFNQTVTLSGSGVPTGSTCSLSSSSIALTGSSPTSVTVSVTTLGSSARHALVGDASRLGGMGIYLSVCGLPGLLLLARRRHRSNKWKSTIFHGLIFLAVLCVGTTGCGGGGSSGGGGGGGTAASTYNLTVTGTSTSGSTNLMHTTTLNSGRSIAEPKPRAVGSLSLKVLAGLGVNCRVDRIGSVLCPWFWMLLIAFGSPAGFRQTVFSRRHRS
jgi:hypothetical protein